MEESRSPASQGNDSTQQPHRSRSRSITSNAAPLQYSPETHPTTDPSLLALTQQQVSIPESSVPIDSALMEQPQVETDSTGYAIDPALGGTVQAPAPAPLPPAPTAAPGPVRAPTASPVVEMEHDHNIQVPEEEKDTDMGFGEDENAGPSGRNSKRASTATEDSDAELRRLAQENASVELDELAKRVRNDENTPSAEKTRQVYGLGWLMRNCERVPDTSVAVPRNRVYARYVGICANERIKPLNPASFGKLVRLMFPEIKTRRLGVRGQSKYHYCGIRLAGEHSSPKVSQGSGSASGSEPSAQAAGDDHLTNNNIASPFSIPFSKSTDKSFKRSSSYKSIQNFHESPLQSFMLRELSFSRNDPDTLCSPHDVLKLPSIDPYIPQGTDPDIAATLTAIYRSHCTSLVECVRYMRLKQFHQLFISFHGTLTAPVHKLLGDPAVVPWIRESDWVMYKEMIRLLSPLALQVVPSFVLGALRHLAGNLTSHISSTFSCQPSHVIQAKLASASIFASLLDRLMRVNDAAHAAARFLGNPPDREQMIRDWRTYVVPQTIIDRELPCRAPAVNQILTEDVVALLQPVSSFSGNGLSPTEESSSSTESVLDRWTQFLTNLPNRFPQMEPRQFNVCLGAVASAALRDLTTNGAVSFGSWWVVRCWIDEWMSWLAERGGFLNHSVPSNIKENGIGPHGGLIDRVFMERISIGRDSTENGDELGHDDSGVSLRGEEPLHLLDDVGDDRDNRMIPVNFAK